MKWLGVVLGVLIGVPLLFLASIYAVSEVGGEVIVLHRTTEDGSISPVRLWIVDDGGASLLEHGPPDAHWMQQLASTPTLTIERDGETATYRASADPGSHDRYHELRKQKYGWADGYIELATQKAEDCSSVPVRLQRVEGSAPTS